MIKYNWTIRWKEKLDKIEKKKEFSFGYIVKIRNIEINGKTCTRHMSDFFIIPILPLVGLYG